MDSSPLSLAERIKRVDDEILSICQELMEFRKRLTGLTAPQSEPRLSKTLAEVTVPKSVQRNSRPAPSRATEDDDDGLV